MDVILATWIPPAQRVGYPRKRVNSIDGLPHSLLVVYLALELVLGALAVYFYRRHYCDVEAR